MALMRPRAGQVNFDVTDITDPLIRLNSGQTGSNDKDSGIVIERGSDTNVAVIWDESADELAIVNTAEDGSTSGNVTISSYANVRANAYYGDGSNLTGISSNYGDSDVATYLSSNGYGTSSSIIASITDSAPGTLDTLNELAAALGDDANFSTTVTNSIATKWTQDNTKISNWDAAFGWGDHSTEGYITSYTDTNTTYTAGTGLSLIGTEFTNTAPDQTVTVTGAGATTITGTYPDFLVTSTNTNTTYSAGTGIDLAGTTFSIDSTVATLAGPTFTGTPAAPTAAAGTNTTQIATTQFVSNAVSNLVDTAPEALNTLNELAAALGDDANFSTTISTQIGAKLDSSSYTAADVLAKIKTVDGSGSGLDADLLDGQHGSYYYSPANAPDPTLTLNGDVSGSATFTNLGNATLTVTVANDSHTHVFGNITSTSLSSASDLDGHTTRALAHWGSSNPANSPAAYGAMFVIPDGSQPQQLVQTYGSAANKVSLYGRRKTGGTWDTVWTQYFSDHYHPNADKWTTARTLSLSGDASGSVSWDGSANATLSVTVADDSHNHTIANVDGLQTALDGKLSTSGKAADSNLLDGIDSGSFLRSDTNDTTSGTLTVQTLTVNSNTFTTTSDIALTANSVINAENSMNFGLTDGSSGYYSWRFGNTSKTGGTAGSTEKMKLTAAGALTVNGATAWTSGNDGSGSGLDADLLDGQHGSYYTGYTDTAIANLVDSSPATLDTLNELAAALNDDPNFATTVTTNIGTKVSKSGDTMSSDLIVSAIGANNNAAATDNIKVSGYGIVGNRATFYVTNNGTVQIGVGGTHNSNSAMTFGTNSNVSQKTLYENSNRVFTDGYHPNADKWTTARTLSLSGDASGSVSWDGSSNATLSVSVGDADTVDGLQGSQFLRSDADDTASGSYSFTNSYNEFGNSTGSVSNDGSWNARVNIAGSSHARLDVKSVSDGIITSMFSHTGHGAGKMGTYSNHPLQLIINGSEQATLSTAGSLSTTAQGTLWGSSNDGSGSGLDADTVDGIQASSFLRSDTSDTMSGNLNMGDNNVNDIGKLNFNNHEGTDYGLTGDVMFDENFYADTEYGTAWSSSNGGGLSVYNEDGWGRILTDRNIQWHTATFDGLKVGSNTVWHAGNDGSGSGLDADTLDGMQPASTNTASTVVSRDASGNFSAGTITATATAAQYADLAEKYTTVNGDLPAGTAVAVGVHDNYEVTPASASDFCIGVVSTDPAYMMNSEADGQYIGLKGRLPVRVIGPVSKGQAVYAYTNGVCRTISTNALVGIALESNSNEEEKLVECVLKV